jgi:hypothetical protein
MVELVELVEIGVKMEVTQEHLVRVDSLEMQVLEVVIL